MSETRIKAGEVVEGCHGIIHALIEGDEVLLVSDLPVISDFLRKVGSEAREDRRGQPPRALGVDRRCVFITGGSHGYGDETKGVMTMTTDNTYTRDLSTIFSDSDSALTSKDHSEIDGKKIGAVLATKNPGFDFPALNKAELDGLVCGKSEGRLDEVYVVAAKVNGEVLKYFDCIDAEALAIKLANETPRNGRLGLFYILNPAIGFPASTDDES